MKTTYRRIRHAAHYQYNHPAKGHDLDQWDVCSKRYERTEEVPADADYHSGYLDRDGNQHWLFVRRAPLSPGDCVWCRARSATKVPA